MTSVLCRIGGKKGKLKDMIIKKMPVDFDLYVEPFVGSGGIYFGADLKNKKSILNDSDKDVMDLYKIMKSGFTMKQYNIPQEVEVQTRFAHATHTNPTDKLLSIIMLGCSSFGGIGRKNNNKMYKPMSSNNIKRKLNHAMDNKEYLKNTRLLNGIKGKFLLSINDSSRIRNLFKGFKQTRVFVKGGSGHKKEEVNTIGYDREELLISNY